MENERPVPSETVMLVCRVGAKIIDWLLRVGNRPAFWFDRHFPIVVEKNDFGGRLLGDKTGFLLIRAACVLAAKGRR